MHPLCWKTWLPFILSLRGSDKYIHAAVADEASIRVNSCRKHEVDFDSFIFLRLGMMVIFHFCGKHLYCIEELLYPC